MKSGLIALARKYAPSLWEIVVTIRVKLTPIRRYIESKLIPAARARIGDGDILYVGVAHYTRDYPQRFAPATVATIDIEPSVARYGAAVHRVGSVTQVDTLFGKQSFDMVFLIGVIGWGLNTREQANAALESISEVLRDGGVLIVSRDDIPPRNSVQMQDLHALTRFEPCELAGIDASRVKIRDPKYRTELFFYRKL
ncbi:MAG TPA: class I SAM-dependent methyltransferase [Povalibacter sp.]|uniref:class I SAM-dependent methyltransferase n=1 Tax=Povalibacter sp. TaxID=1962978 RepID=UPI002BC408D1|nr:class I SAM-dependent methyltransferase [Povalibacter sp.]HMN42976.1 class I SAM-dependent methyltransferase [Povalibacter sp.]